MEPKAAMQKHGSHDWCHLCGLRSEKCVDVWYPDNAEHDPPVRPGLPGADRRYVRICAVCGERIASVATT
jgi:hypothetical protein